MRIPWGGWLNRSLSWDHTLQYSLVEQRPVGSVTVDRKNGDLTEKDDSYIWGCYTVSGVFLADSIRYGWGFEDFPHQAGCSASRPSQAEAEPHFLRGWSPKPASPSGGCRTYVSTH